MIDLEEVSVALDAFPDWDENMRAEVYHAVDLAPEEPLSSFALAQDYYPGGAHAAWMRVREYVLSPNAGKRWAYTLAEAAGYESAPTKEEILRSLWRGAGMIR